MMIKSPIYHFYSSYTLTRLMEGGEINTDYDRYKLEYYLNIMHSNEEMKKKKEN